MCSAGRTNTKDSPQSVESILLVLIAGIGDVVLASPSFRAIRNGYPDAQIHLLTSTEAAPLAANYPYIDHVYPFPIRELRKSKRYSSDMMKMARFLRKKRYDMLINLYQVCSLTGAAKMGLLFSLLRAKVRFGQAAYGFGIFLDRSVPRENFQEKHVVDAMIKIAELAGGLGDGKGLEVFWKRGVEDKWKEVFAEFGQKLLVGINPGGDRENRRWAPDRFAAVADHLIKQFNLQAILLGGPADKEIASDIAHRIERDVSDFSGRIPLDALPFIISRLDLLITNDSGPMHIAAATGTPLIALFGPENPQHFGPYAKKELYRVLYKFPCDGLDNNAEWRPTSVNLITAEVVSAEAEALLCQRRQEIK
ncbi:MAG: glycosyltransferase family 9 protein [Syntrophales bacterium]